MSAAEFASSVNTWVDDVRACIAEVDDGLGHKLADRVVLDPNYGPAAVGPAVIVSAPVMNFETFCADGPSDLEVTIYVIGDASDSQVLTRLLAITLGVCEALETCEREISVDQARAGAWMQDGIPRPAYVIRGTGSLT